MWRWCRGAERRLPAALLAAAAGSAGAGAPAPEVEYGGCATVVAGPVCMLGAERRLTLWVRVPPEATVELDRRGLRSAEVVGEAQGGQRYELTVARGATQVTLRTGPRRGGAAWTLRVAEETAPPFVDEARLLREAGRSDEARELLVEVSQRAEGVELARALSALGRLRNRSGDVGGALQALERAVALYEAHGRRYDALYDAVVIAFMLTNGAGRFGAAHAVLAPFAEPWSGPAEAGYFLAYFRGLASMYAGDARAALRDLTTAADTAERFGWTARRLHSEQLLAVQLQMLGRRAEADALLAAWRDRLPPEQAPCRRGQYLTNLGWSLLLGLEAGDAVADPTPVLVEAQAIFDEHCSDTDRVNGRINLALAALHGERLDEARRHLARAQAVTGEPELRMALWAQDIGARVALREGDVRVALARFTELEQLAAATSSPSARWRAATGRAAALAALGEREDALEAYAAADRQLDADISRVPFDAGRERLLAARAWVTGRHLALLIDAGRDEEAFAVARRARSRMLRSLTAPQRRARLAAAERDRWDRAMAAYRELHEELAQEARRGWYLPADERRRLQALREGRERDLRRLYDDALAALDPPPAPEHYRRPGNGELVLAFHPVPGGWASFADDGVTLRVRRENCAEERTEALASCLLRPLAASLRGAKRLYLLPGGALRGVDFHALPFDDGVLLDAAAVVYGLDSEPAGEAPPSGYRAALVGDPHGNLAAARREIRAVQAVLDQTGLWSASLLEGSGADSAAVRRLLAGADLFHFAGHARFRGRRGWDSELQLAAQSSLDVADILALEHVPPFVVLSGCETAATSADATPESIGIAQAFLARGARSVLAAVRPVDDETAYALVQGYYREWAAGLPPPEALRAAQLELRRQRPDADWSTFRLMES